MGDLGDEVDSFSSGESNTNLVNNNVVIESSVQPNNSSKKWIFVLVGVVLFLVIVVVVMSWRGEEGEIKDDVRIVNPDYPRKCETLSGFDKRDCYTLVAKLKKDYSVCDALSEYYNNSCYIRAYEAIGDPNNCERFTDEVPKSACYQVIAIKNLDSSLCSKAQMRDGCYSKVAVGLGDKSICENIKDETMREICFAVINTDVDSCKKLRCMTQLALFKDDVTFCGENPDCLIRFPVTEKLCDDIVHRQPRDQCFFKLADSTENIEYCSRIGVLRYGAGWGNYPGISREECFVFMAVKLRDSSVCESAGSFKKECLWKVDILP